MLESQLDESLTLLKLGLWTEDIKLKLRMMKQVVEDAKGELGVIQAKQAITAARSYQRFTPTRLMATRLCANGWTNY